MSVRATLEPTAFVDSGYCPRAVALRLSRRLGVPLARSEGGRGARIALYWLNRSVGRVLPRGGVGEARAGGLRIALPLGHHDLRHSYLTGRYEPEVQQMAEAVLRAGDVAVDVGANVGWHTLHFARLVGETGCVFAFEPNPAARVLLEHSVSRNRFEDCVRVRPEALGETVGSVRVYIDRDAGLLSSLQPHAWLGGDSIASRSSTLDAAVLPALDSRPRLLKVDVEGAEYEVLSGGASLFECLPPEYLVVELSSLRSGVPILELLSECGYEAVEFHDGHMRAARLRPPPVSEARPGTGSFSYVNALFRHMSVGR